MRKNLPTIVILSMILATALIAFSCGPADTVTTGTLAGRITVDGAVTGNIGFMVAIAGTAYLAVTDDAGNFEITEIPAGSGYALCITPPVDSAVEPVLYGTTFTIIMGQTTEAGTIDLEAVADTRTVTMTITNIPAGYGTARLRFYNSYQLNSNYYQEIAEYSSNTATITEGHATMTYEIPLEKIENLSRREIWLSLILFNVDAPDVPVYFVTWKKYGDFMRSNSYSYNTATEEGRFVLAVTGLTVNDQFYIKSTITWRGCTISMSVDNADGSKVVYAGFTQTYFDATMIDCAANGNSFIFWRGSPPLYFAETYIWSGITDTFDYNTLTTLSLADADTRTKEIQLYLFDVDADTQSALNTETSMIFRTGTTDTVVSLPLLGSINIDAAAWDAMIPSGFTVSITLADTVYTWSDVFTSNRVYLSFLDAVETPAP